MGGFERSPKPTIIIRNVKQSWCSASFICNYIVLNFTTSSVHQIHNVMTEKLIIVAFQRWSECLIFIWWGQSQHKKNTQRKQPLNSFNQSFTNAHSDIEGLIAWRLYEDGNVIFEFASPLW